MARPYSKFAIGQWNGDPGVPEFWRKSPGCRTPFGYIQHSDPELYRVIPEIQAVLDMAEQYVSTSTQRDLTNWVRASLRKLGDAFPDREDLQDLEISRPGLYGVFDRRKILRREAGIG
jgi:hypothetical protein